MYRFAHGHAQDCMNVCKTPGLALSLSLSLCVCMCVELQMPPYIFCDEGDGAGVMCTSARLLYLQTSRGRASGDTASRTRGALLL